MTRSERALWPMAGIRLRGWGSYLPRHAVENPCEIDPASPSSIDAQVLGKIGVHTRYVAAEDETIPYMAARAGLTALADAEMEIGDVDLVVLSNWTSPPFTPDHAPTTARLMGHGQAYAFDVRTACLGFIHAVQLAAMYLVSTGATTAVVTCAEQFSRRVRPGSKGSLICSDGAGAAVLVRTPGGPAGLKDTLVRSDGDRAEVIGALPPLGHVRSLPSLPEEAVSSIVSASTNILERNGLIITDVDWVVPHPGTDVVHTRVRDGLGVPKERFLVNLDRVGNVSSASIPLVIAEERASGRLRPGDLVLSPAIGAGWYYGAMLHELD